MGKILRKGPRVIDQNNFGDQRSMQAYNNGQLYTMCFPGQTVAGASTDFNIQLGGKARRLHGICMFFPNASINDDDIMSLTVNNEQIIIKAIWKAYSPNQNHNPFKVDQFFKIPRALSGSDTVTLNIASVNAHAFFPVFYLSNA